MKPEKHINATNHLCFECRACEQVCTISAIQIVCNKDGFAYPVVDEERCVDCGLCTKVCPAINATQAKTLSGKVFALQSKNKSLLGESSSGGMFSLIAEWIIDKKGVVFGAAWDDNMQLHHIAVEDKDSLARLRGSKYVHSDIGQTYKEAQKYLKQGRWVYFTGTPCQIAGLKLYLRKDYDTLITSDLVCHGTPSQLMFNRFVKQMESERGETVVDYRFRDKRVMGWSCSSSSSSSRDSKGKIKYVFYDKNMIAYFQAFIKGHITREDCYQCPFATPQRVSDITLADYWDVEKHLPRIPNMRDGVSLVLVNTSKGRWLLELVREKANVYESSIEDALNTSNHNLKAATDRPKERDNSYILAEKDFVAFRDSYLVGAKPESYYRKVYRNVKIKNYWFVRKLLKIAGKR